MLPAKLRAGCFKAPPLIDPRKLADDLASERGTYVMSEFGTELSEVEPAAQLGSKLFKDTIE